MIWSDVLTVTLGAFLGAGAAFGSNLLVRLLESRRAEAAALNELVTEIHFRRVLRRVRATRSPDAAASDPDWQHARRSIGALRGVIRAARRRTRPRSTALPVLNEMTLACNTFLDDSDDQPDLYRLHLMQLHARLNASVRRLRDDRRAIADLEPGEAHLSPTVSGLTPPTLLADDVLRPGGAGSVDRMTTDARDDRTDLPDDDLDGTVTLPGVRSAGGAEKAGTADEAAEIRRQEAAPGPADVDVASDEYPEVPDQDGLTGTDRRV
ncbi:hypothetical protein [Frigoribacterium faeni]|uniref:hypothetical protein n=1 Tax=Frigoribacterium faeni TaxID=145483 RepID=UPI00141B778A|nr:hypothetical protein [Frigoribacterium faeni]NIJ06208.1 hypothetical protein [Frigoribacterium faeni]